METYHFYSSTDCPIGSLAKFCLKQTGKFMMIEVHSRRPYNPDFETRPLTASETAEVNTALAQKYTYFGYGGQAFVFFSEDGQYVLKLFKQRHFRQPTYLNHIPFIEEYRQLKFKKRDRLLRREYGSYKLDFEELQEESALLFLHLNPTHHLKRKLTLVDKLNIEHSIDLDTTDFIVQRRVSLVFDSIYLAMERGDTTSARAVISEIVRLIVDRCKRGYGDRDPSIDTNCGILNGKAVKLDIGRLYHDPNRTLPLFYKPELFHITRPLRTWLVKNHPELVSHLDSEVNQVIFHD